MNIKNPLLFTAKLAAPAIVSLLLPLQTGAQLHSTGRYLGRGSTIRGLHGREA